MGREPENIPEETLHRVFERVSKDSIEIVTYSDLFRFATELYQSTKLVLLPGRIGETRDALGADLQLAKQLGVHDVEAPADSFLIEMSDDSFPGFTEEQIEHEILEPACMSLAGTVLRAGASSLKWVATIGSQSFVAIVTQISGPLDDEAQFPEWIGVEMRLLLGPVVLLHLVSRQKSDFVWQSWQHGGGTRVDAGNIDGNVDLGVDMPFSRAVFERLRAWFRSE